jgi:tetratricopeptide (TPR) repeat protein
VAVADALAGARALVAVGRHDEAGRLLALVLAEDPENETGLLLLAQGFYARRLYQQAAETVGRLLRAHPDSRGGLTTMAWVQVGLRRARVGLPFASRAVELHPDSADCLRTLAAVLRAIDRGSAQALALAERAIALDPEDVIALRVICDVYLDRGEYAEAERWALRALSITPSAPGLILQLGLTRAGLNRFDESHDQVAAALRADPRADAIDQVISHVEFQGVPAHLDDIYRLALAARGRPDLRRPGAAGGDPELLAAQGLLARRLHTNRATQGQAVELADAVLAADPANQDARCIRAMTLGQTGQRAQREEAVWIAEQLAAEGYLDGLPVLRATRLGLVAFLLAQHDHVAALTVIREATADTRDPTSLATFLFDEADCLVKLGRCAEALPVAARVVELLPSARRLRQGYPPPDLAQVTLGQAAWGAGDLELAERALRAGVAAGPGKGYPAVWLARLLAETGRWQQAQELLGELRADLPDRDLTAGACEELVAAVLARAGGAARRGRPGPDLVAELSRWMDLLRRPYELLAAAPRTPATTQALARLSALVATFRKKFRAPADSDYGRNLAGLKALVEPRLPAGRRGDRARGVPEHTPWRSG